METTGVFFARPGGTERAGGDAALAAAFSLVDERKRDMGGVFLQWGIKAKRQILHGPNVDRGGPLKHRVPGLLSFDRSQKLSRNHAGVGRLSWSEGDGRRFAFTLRAHGDGK